MALHARSVAVAAGATGSEVERVATIIVEARDITLEAARKALEVTRSARDDRALETWERVDSAK
jgi:hydroxymethylglutaryl-CoA reductase